MDISYLHISPTFRHYLTLFDICLVDTAIATRLGLSWQWSATCFGQGTLRDAGHWPLALGDARDGHFGYPQIILIGHT